MMEGMLVVELANVLAGPTVCQFLAELGADVVKVENSSTRGDVTRTWKLKSEAGGDAGGSGGVTAYFSCCNLGKKAIAMDIRQPEALAVVHQLAAKADVVVASYKPGDAEKLGVDEATLRALNPKLIYAQITGYGLDDPRAGYDAVIQAESGFQFMNGPPGGSPVDGVTKMPVALMDLLAAHQLKEGLLVALWNRERTGRGDTVSISLIQAGVNGE
jgi:crotonobetainyl-CoA:carnitine CoA-transferase CaiB-like acyl-CoA transferase